jgi:hypothetical protein
MKTVLLCVVLALVLAATPVEAQIQNAVTDPSGDVLDSKGNRVSDRPDLDILYASVEFTWRQIKFTMRLASNVLSQPTYGVVYCWGLDLDRNSKTGDPQGTDIGKEANVCVRYDPNQSHSEYGWHGFIDDLVHDAYAKGPLSTFSISGSNIEMTIASEALRDPLGTDWIAGNGADLIPGSLWASDRAPDQGHATILFSATTQTTTVLSSEPAQTQTETLVSVRTETESISVLFGPLSTSDTLLLVALAVLAPAAYVVGRRTRKPVSAAEPPRTGLFEVSVTVPSVGKTVSIEAGPDHTIGSLVDTLISTLNLPKNRAYTVEYAGKLVSQPDFGKTLATFGIKEGSKLSLRVLE